jgi:hypothetical protein
MDENVETLFQIVWDVFIEELSMMDDDKRRKVIASLVSEFKEDFEEAKRE